MRFASIIGALAFACASMADAQSSRASCYYVADSVGDEATIIAASQFVFPFRIGQPATDESRAINAAMERAFGDDLRSIGNAWLSERTLQGRRYLHTNGLTVQLSIEDCNAGLSSVRAYLLEVEELAPSPEMMTTIEAFRANARQLNETEFFWASPPIPVAVEPPAPRG